MKKDTLENRIRKGNKRLFFWTSGWLLSTAASAFGPKLIWDFNITVTIVVMLITFMIGIKMLIENKNMLDGLDELQRKMHFNAMAVSLGITMITGSLYGLLQPSGLLENTPAPANLLFVMGISYLVALFINKGKYA